MTDPRDFRQVGLDVALLVTILDGDGAPVAELRVSGSTGGWYDPRLPLVEQLTAASAELVEDAAEALTGFADREAYGR